LSRLLLTIGLFAGLMPFAAPALGAPYEPDDPIENPNLDAVCGLDVLMILDESGSIENSDATDNVIDAYTTFVSALNNTGSRVGVVEFSKVARLPIDEYVTVTDQTLANRFLPYINNNYDPSGNTNWEDALRAARYFMERPSLETPHLVMFITDGDPTEAIDWNRVTYDPGNPSVGQNEYENKLPLTGDEETNSSDANPGKDRAVSNANGIKFQGSHMFTVGIGNALDNQSSVDRLIDVSGPDIFDGLDDPLDISTDDLALVTDFDDLAAALRAAAFGLCAPSVTVQKAADSTPDTGLEDAFPVSGVEITGEVTAPGGVSDWLIPPDATGTTAVQETDGAGFATFQWQPGAEGAAQMTVTEQDPATDPATEDYVLDPAFSECTFITAGNDTPQPVPDFVLEPLGYSFTVPFESIVTCQLLNRIPAAPAIDIEKFTEGSDADEPDGADVPFVPAGEQVSWEYVVTNTGNVTLTGVTVTDAPAQTVTCPETTLPPGESMTCTASATAADTTGMPDGVYANTATVTGTYEGATETDADPSHYASATSGVRIIKRIVTPTVLGGDPDPSNTFDANTQSDVPAVAVGEDIEYTFEVSNAGTADITSYTVDDPVLGPITCPGGADGIVAGGPSEFCDPFPTTSVAGAQRNMAVVNAEFAVGDPHSDSDPARYFGAAPDIDVEKLTNLVDADLPADAPEIPVGERVVWIYRVENTGNVPLGSFTLTDDQQGTPACPRPTLPVGAVHYCFLTATAEPTIGLPGGVYANEATVTSEAPVHTILGGAPLTVPVGDDDPSHYRGMLPDIDIEKATNGDDADLPTGPFIVPGAGVTWDYVVTNTGNLTLANVAVLDPVLRSVVCTQADVVPGGQFSCQATGTAVEGQYVNGGLAVGITQNPQLVVDFDLSHYYGVSGTINLEKFTNGFDADTVEESPYLDVGEDVTWSYIVRNEGNSVMSDIAVVDDQLGAITCPSDTLAVNEEMTCTATGTAEQGLYENTATVTGLDAAGTAHEDTDPSHYRGVEPGIFVEKLTNGQDADEAPGVQIGQEDEIVWTYAVTTGGHPTADVTVIDDDPAVQPVYVSGDSNDNGILEFGEVWIYQATGSATEAQYENTATVDGFDNIDEIPVSDTDPSNYQAVISVTGGDFSMAPYAAGIILLGLALLVTLRMRRRQN
jgi:uncharacterized repeat protein (TIGR01451 family)